RGGSHRTRQSLVDKPTLDRVRSGWGTPIWAPAPLPRWGRALGLAGAGTRGAAGQPGVWGGLGGPAFLFNEAPLRRDGGGMGQSGSGGLGPSHPGFHNRRERGLGALFVSERLGPLCEGPSRKHGLAAFGRGGLHEPDVRHSLRWLALG